jgi:hypothetical protein
MFCPDCGTQLPDTAAFCENCGRQLQVQDQQIVESMRTAGSAVSVSMGVIGTQRGTSNIPLIMGIIGAVLMLPALFCSACAAGVAAGASGSDEATATAILIVIGLLPIGLGVVGGVFGKSKPLISMILLLSAAILTFIGWILVMFASIFHLAALILFIVGGIMAKVQKME